MVYVSGNQESTHEQPNYEIIQKVKRITASTIIISTQGDWQGTCMVTMGGIPEKECLTSHYSVTAGTPLDVKMFVSTEKNDNVLHEQDVVIAEYDRPVDLPLKFDVKVKFFPLISDLAYTNIGDHNVARKIGTTAFKNYNDGNGNAGTVGTVVELTGREGPLGATSYILPSDVDDAAADYECFHLTDITKWQLPEENWAGRPYSFQIHLKVEH